MRIKNLPSIESMNGSQDALVIEQTDGSEDKSRKVSPAQIKQYVLNDMDEVPTENSDNPVKSGGIFSTMAVPKYDATNRREYYEGGSAFSGNIDSAPTAGSNNAVASGGTKTYVDNAVGAKQDLLKIISGTLPNSVSALLIPYPTGVTKNDYVVIGWNILSNNNKYSGFNMGGSSSVRLLQIAMMDNGVQVTNDESAFFGKTIQIVLAKV